MAGASLDPSGHDPATAPRIAVAGAIAGEAPNRAAVLTFATIAALTLMALTAASYAQAQTLNLPAMRVEGKAEPRIGGHNTAPCAAADTAGRKAGDTDCAARKLQDAAKAAQDRAKDQPIPNVPTATSPDTQIGVANEAATKQRLGDSFGKSVLPQRPTPPPPEPSPLARH